MWLDPWQFRIPIVVPGTSGINEDYPVLLRIAEGILSPSPYEVNLNGFSLNFPSGKNQGGDLRFTTSDGTTLLSFWIEDVQGTAPGRVAWVWVKIPVNYGITQTIYVYFGNSSATNASNPNNTFTFFDDFDSYSYTAINWGVGHNIMMFSVSSSILTLNVNTGSGGIPGAAYCKYNFSQKQDRAVGTRCSISATNVRSNFIQMIGCTLTYNPSNPGNPDLKQIVFRVDQFSGGQSTISHHYHHSGQFTTIPDYPTTYNGEFVKVEASFRDYDEEYYAHYAFRNDYPRRANRNVVASEGLNAQGLAAGNENLATYRFDWAYFRPVSPFDIDKIPTQGGGIETSPGGGGTTVTPGAAVITFNSQSPGLGLTVPPANITFSSITPNWVLSSWSYNPSHAAIQFTSLNVSTVRGSWTGSVGNASFQFQAFNVNTVRGSWSYVPPPSEIQFTALNVTTFRSSWSGTPPSANLTLQSFDVGTIRGSWSYNPGSANLTFSSLNVSTFLNSWSYNPSPANITFASINPSAILGNWSYNPSSANINFSSLDASTRLGSWTGVPSFCKIEFLCFGGSVVGGSVNINPDHAQFSLTSHSPSINRGSWSSGTISASEFTLTSTNAIANLGNWSYNPASASTEFNCLNPFIRRGSWAKNVGSVDLQFTSQSVGTLLGNWSYTPPSCSINFSALNVSTTRGSWSSSPLGVAEIQFQATGGQGIAGSFTLTNLSPATIQYGSTNVNFLKGSWIGSSLAAPTITFSAQTIYHYITDENDAPWLDNDWNYRIPITIPGGAGRGVGYSVLIRIAESIFSPRGRYEINLFGLSEKFPYGKNRGGDFRFTLNDGVTPIPFWVEKVEFSRPGRIAWVWIRLPVNLDNDQTIFLYFGNPYSDNFSDPYSTFIFFDDFEGFEINKSSWGKMVNIHDYSVGSSILSVVNEPAPYNAVILTSLGQVSRVACGVRTRLPSYNGHTWQYRAGVKINTKISDGLGAGFVVANVDYPKLRYFGVSDLIFMHNIGPSFKYNRRWLTLEIANQEPGTWVVNFARDSNYPRLNMERYFRSFYFSPNYIALTGCCDFPYSITDFDWCYVRKAAPSGDPYPIEGGSIQLKPGGGRVVRSFPVEFYLSSSEVNIRIRNLLLSSY